MKLFHNPPRETWNEIIARPTFSFEEIEEKVKPIMEAVKLNGDTALHKFSEKFDSVRVANLMVTPQEISEAQESIDAGLKTAMKVARENIEKFHQSQKEPIRKVETIYGVTCWRKSVPIEKVGLYIPGGTAPLFSTVLMLGVPAKIAGCKEVILCTPPNKEGKVHPAILYAAHLVGITSIYKVGGAQAIAAMTYGTETIPAMYKIFGPGNQYVTAAKQLATKAGVAIDLPAGPSEVLVLADKTANPAFIAADLLSQAEHGPDSQVILVSTNEALVVKTKGQIERQLEKLPRRAIAQKALENSTSVIMEDLGEALALTNAYAAEHLIIAMNQAEEIAEKIVNAGSVFIGHYTPESAGDYASGTNHTLPTNGYARNYSGVSLDSFFRKITFQSITDDGLKILGPHIEKMAMAEELEAHKNAITIRLETLS